MASARLPLRVCSVAQITLLDESSRVSTRVNAHDTAVSAHLGSEQMLLHGSSTGSVEISWVFSVSKAG